jgi:uncharacterized protein YndB with AHSA1/START domain
MTTTTDTRTVQVYRVYIKATPQAIWEAITKPEWTQRYGYGGRAEFDLRPGGAFRARSTEAMTAEGAAMGYEVPDVIVDGEVVESDPPRRLVQTWRLLMDPGTAEEGFTRLTYEIEEGQGGATRLTVIHELESAPNTTALVTGLREAEGAGGGWAWVLSDLKTLLETGKPLAS